MPHGIYDWDTLTRSTYAVMDDYGDLIVLGGSAYWFLFPQYCYPFKHKQ